MAGEDYVIYAHTSSSHSGDIEQNHGHGGYDIWVAQLTTAGKIVRSGVYWGSGSESYSADGNSVRTSDGGYAFITTTNSDRSGDLGRNHGNGFYDIWVVKLKKVKHYIRVRPIGQKQAGDKFTIDAEINLPACDDVLVYVHFRTSHRPKIVNSAA